MTDSNKTIAFSADYFSHIRSFTLDNGLRIFVNEKHDAPTVAVHCCVETGSIYEGEYLGCGLSHFLEHMLFQGCKNYPGQKAADTINRLGGDMNAYTSFGSTVYYLELPTEHAETGVDVLSAMVSYPTFPEKKFKFEKDVILRERDMGLDRPERVLAEKLWQTVFLKHPIRHPIIGYHEKIEQVTRTIMADYYERRYSPERTFFVVSGDIAADDAAEMIRKRLENWPRGNISELLLPEEAPQHCQRENLCTFDDPLARIAVAGRVPPSTHPDVPALDILCGILGQSKSARLIKRLRNKMELAVSIGSFNYTPNFAGLFAIIASTQPEKFPELEKALMKELETLCKNGVSPEEIEREKYQQATEYIRTLKTNNGIAGVIANTVLSYGSPVMADRYLNLLSSVDQDDIIRVSREYLHPDKLSIIRQFPSAEKAAEIVKAQTALESPKPEKSTLNSGATCISLPDNRLPLVDIGLIIPGGCMFENQDNCGISRLLASMLTAGTKSFSEEKFNQLIDDNAIDLGVTSGANSMLIKLNCPKDRLPVALDILNSMLTEPTFNKRELDREKNNLIQVLKSRAMTPQGAAEDKMFELLYGSHPYALPRSGKPESIAKITARSLRNYFNTRFVPASTFIGVAGDVTSSEAAEITQSIDSVLKWNTGKSDIFPEAPEFPEEDIFEEITLPREQAMIIFAIPGCDNLTEDRFAFDIAQNALNGLSSEIFKKVREDAGLAYSTGVMFTRGYHKGIVGFFAGTTRENAEEVAELLRSERDRLAKSGLTTKEFDAAREGALFACASQMERNDALLMNSLLSEFYGNGYMAPWKAAETFRNITRSRTNKILQRYFADTASVLVIAGPAAK